MEILVVIGLMAVITVGTLQLATVSMQSSQVVRGTFSEQELRIAVNNILTNDNYCKANLKPEAGRLTGSNSQKGIGTISKLEQDGVALLEEGKSFKGNLDIVKLELTGDATQNPKTATVNRKFVVYYSKKQTKDLNTLDGGDCTSSDTSGCYFLECDLDYRLENVASNPDVVACDTLNCVGGDNISCYTVDFDGPSITQNVHPDSVERLISPGSELGKGRALIGCGGTSKIPVSTVTAFGFESGINTIPGTVVNQKGAFNVFMGYHTGYSNTLGSNDTFVGYQAGYANTLGSSNVFLGSNAGYFNTTGKSNIFIGAAVGHSNTTGDENVYIGRYAGFSATTARNNVFVGHEAGKYTTEDDTTSSIFEASHNVFIGHKAGRLNATGVGNTYIGARAGQNSNTARWNTFLGMDAGRSNITGSQNTFLGAATGKYNETSIHNLYVGGGSGYFNKAGENTFVGFHSGAFYGTGKQNVFLGGNAGICIPSTPFTYLWVDPGGEAERQAWSVNCTGDKNTFLGFQAGIYNTSGNENIYIGSEVGPPNSGSHVGISKTGSNQLNIGNLILGKLNTSAPPSSNPFIPSSPGAVIHGTLDVAKKLKVHADGLEVEGGINLTSGVFSCGGSTCPSMPGHNHNGHHALDAHTHPYSPSGHGHSGYAPAGHSHGTPSSRVYKKNIKKFKNFERVYKDIKKTPLFTYEYKEDHPNKSRMGFISEELPHYLQIKDKGQPSMPDMPSIYGTFWAAIKALIIKFEGFKENTLSALKKVTEEVIAIKENTSSAIKTLTEKVTVIINEIEEIKKTWAKEKEEIKKLNTLILLQQEILTSQQEALTSQQKELTQLKIKLKDIEEAQQKVEKNKN